MVNTLLECICSDMVRFSLRKKNGKMKTIVLSALKQHRTDDGFERQETEDGDFDTSRYSKDRIASANNRDSAAGVTIEKVALVELDEVPSIDNEATLLTNPTSSTSISSQVDTSIPLPPKLLRRSVAFPMFFASDRAESSTTNRDASRIMGLDDDGEQTQGEISSKTEPSRKVPYAFSSPWQIESEVRLFRSGAFKSAEEHEDKTTLDDSFDHSEKSLFRKVSSKLTYLSHDDTVDEVLSSIPTMTQDMHRCEWFPNRICLLSFDNDRSPGTNGDGTNAVELSQKTKSTWMKYFVPVPQCIVRNSCGRHVRWHSSTLLGSDTFRATPGIALSDRFRSENHIHKDTSSMILHDPIQAKYVIMDFCRNQNYSGAIVLAKHLLRHYQLQLSHHNSEEKNQSNSPHTSDIILSLHRQIAIVCVVAGRNGEAIRHSTEAVTSLAKVTDSTTGHVHDANCTDGNFIQSAQAVDTLLLHGLVLFSTNKVGQAMKACREGLQMAITLNGFEDSTVAILLCNIGVFHLECGNTKASLRSLEESLEIQRSILRAGTEARQFGSADEAIHRLAITMCNLAVAYEGIGQVDQTTSLLEESISLYQSIELDTSIDEEVVTKRLHFLIDHQYDERYKKIVDVTVLNTSDEAEDGICQFYELNHSRNSDAVQSFISSAFSDDDEEDAHSNDMSDTSERSLTLFGNSDGVPSSRVRPWLWLEESDSHDFLLLGPLQPEFTVEQRVRETLCFWSDSGNGNATTSDSEADEARTGSNSLLLHPHAKEMLKYNLNFNGETVVDADLHLNEIHKQALTYLDENKIDAAVDILYGAVQSHRAKYGATHHLVGSAFHNIGMVLFVAQRYSEALAAFENAVVIRNESLHTNHPDIQCSWIKIALIHLAMGNIHRAHDIFSDIRDKLLQNDIGYGLVQLAKVHNNIGVIACEFNDLDTAMLSFNAAYDCQRDIWKKCLNEKQSDGENGNDSCDWHVLKLERANTLCNMAYVYTQVKDYERGLELYDRAHGIIFRLLPKHHHSIVQVVANIDLLIEAMYNDADQ